MAINRNKIVFNEKIQSEGYFTTGKGLKMYRDYNFDTIKFNFFHTMTYITIYGIENENSKKFLEALNFEYFEDFVKTIIINYPDVKELQDENEFNLADNAILFEHEDILEILQKYFIFPNIMKEYYSK